MNIRNVYLHKEKVRKAFTLIELLIVIAIIGILAGVVLVSTNSSRSKANDTAIIAEANSMFKGIMVYYSGAGIYDMNDFNGPQVDVRRTINDARCDDFFLSMNPQPRNQLVSTCKSILGRQKVTSSFQILVHNSSVIPQNKTQVRMMVWLPEAEVYYCIGSNGKSSQQATRYTQNYPGCYVDTSL
jgi:prepilin-type N-terminal cleavage/methylation domain-containing protein